MSNNTLTPAKLFGIVLLSFATVGLLVWASRLPNIETPAFDAGGRALLGSLLGVSILGLVFVRRTRWVYLPTSILLHVLAIILLLALSFTTLSESPPEQDSNGAAHSPGGRRDVRRHSRPSYDRHQEQPDTGWDRIQRTFTNDGRGSGKLVPRCLFDFKKNHAGFYPGPLP